MTVDEVLDDYPNLDRDQVEAALDYARANPKHGRTLPVAAASRRRSLLSVTKAGGEA
jgi:hypothetical protein